MALCAGQEARAADKKDRHPNFGIKKRYAVRVSVGANRKVKIKRNLWIAGIPAALLLIAGAATVMSRTRTAPAPPPPEVRVAAVEQRDVPIEHEWIGTLAGLVNADIRAQVTGYLLRQDYKEGSFVHKDQLLFEIDPRPFQAALVQATGQYEQAKGQLAQAQAGLSTAESILLNAQATQLRTQLDENRYIPLYADQAATKQELDNARQNNQAQKATVASSKAQVETAKAQIEAARAGVIAAQGVLENAKVNLGFTRITSLIDGIAGYATVQVGNLVGPSSEPLTTVSTLNPIRNNFTVSEQEYLSLARADRLHRLEVTLILADGTVYNKSGHFWFVNRQVDQNTGAIQLTSLFPNPGNLLRPGQYGKSRALVGIDRNALLIPQAAVTELQGMHEIDVVGPDNRVAVRPVKVGERVGTLWVVKGALKPGERVVVEGQQRLRPGMLVNPKPFGGSSGESQMTDPPGGN
jgi:membrane fusion protein (multidrug efflux system)